MHIVSFVGENVKRIKVVRINPKDNTVIIAGKNDQGKSSIIDAIWLALDYKSAIKNIDEALSRGKKKGKSFVDLGDIKVTRTWSQKGTYLKVEPDDKVKQAGGAQALLDSLIGKLSFDPLAFALMKGPEQRTELLSFVDIGIDLDKWEIDRLKIYDERTEVNRNLKLITATIDKFEPVPDDTPDEEVKSVDILADIDAAIVMNDTIITAEERIVTYNESVEIKQAEIKEKEDEILDLKREIGDLNEDIEAKKQFLHHTEKQDVDALKEKLTTIENTNKNVRLLLTHNNNLINQARCEGTAESLTNQLAAMDDQKSKAIESADMPIKGLGVEPDYITYIDTPFKDLSTSKKIKVSMSIAMASKPEVKVVFIKEGSLLDEDNFKVIKDMAEKNGYQLWIEQVDSSGEVGIVIEEGEVKKGDKVKLKSELHETPPPKENPDNESKDIQDVDRNW